MDGINLKPEILCHPNIPKPLHGINPRTIKGQEWWDSIRQEVYGKYNYCCGACGVHKSQAKKHKWLEAHEFWNINYNTGVCEILSIEPLCHYCHNFIHSGRLSMIYEKEKSHEEVVEILQHGFFILFMNDLKCFENTLALANQIGAETFGVKSYPYFENDDLDWMDYKLIFEGQEYKPMFKSYEEWLNHYKSL